MWEYLPEIFVAVIVVIIGVIIPIAIEIRDSEELVNTLRAQVKTLTAERDLLRNEVDVLTQQEDAWDKQLKEVTAERDEARERSKKQASEWLHTHHALQSVIEEREELKVKLTTLSELQSALEKGGK